MFDILYESMKKSSLLKLLMIPSLSLAILIVIIIALTNCSSKDTDPDKDSLYMVIRFESITNIQLNNERNNNTI